MWLDVTTLRSCSTVDSTHICRAGCVSSLSWHRFRVMLLLPCRRLLSVSATVDVPGSDPRGCASTVLSCGWRSVDVDAAASVHRAATAADYVSSVYWCCVRAMVIAPVSTCCAQRCLRRRSSVRRSWMHLLARPPCCDEAGGKWSWMRLWHSSVQPVDWAFRRSLLSTPVSL